MTRRVSKKHIIWPGFVLMLVGLALTSYVIARYFFNKNHKQEPVNKSTVITYSTDKPSEDRPDKKTYRWQGGSNDPKYISIPSTGSEGFLQNVGVDQNKQVAVPNNIYMAGWFNETPRPGEKGNSVIDGHVTGRINKGIFEKLTSIKPGDEIKIEFGDGSNKNFTVKKSVAVPVNNAPAVIFSQDPAIERQLTVVTCTGNWDAKLNQYTERLIVIAQAI